MSRCFRIGRRGFVAELGCVSIVVIVLLAIALVNAQVKGLSYVELNRIRNRVTRAHDVNLLINGVAVTTVADGGSRYLTVKPRAGEDTFQAEMVMASGSVLRSPEVRYDLQPGEQLQARVYPITDARNITTLELTVASKAGHREPPAPKPVTKPVAATLESDGAASGGGRMLATVAAIATVVGAVYAVLSWHRPRKA